MHCHVVLDGAYDGTEMKHSTVMARMREQARSAVTVTTATHKKHSVMPIFGKGDEPSTIQLETFLDAVGRVVQ